MCSSKTLQGHTSPNDISKVDLHFFSELKNDYQIWNHAIGSIQSGVSYTWVDITDYTKLMCEHLMRNCVSITPNNYKSLIIKIKWIYQYPEISHYAIQLSK
jgi:hypothetical protein